MPADDRSARIRELIRTALFDTGGTMVEGAFVDHWESNAIAAVDELSDLFEGEGWRGGDADALRRAVQDPSAPEDAAIRLLDGLRAWTLPLIQSLLDDPSPRVRAIAVKVGSGHLDPAFLLRLARDPDPGVRQAAVLALSARRREVPGAEALLALARRDPAPGVRVAAGSALDFLREPEAAAALAERLVEEGDPQVRRALIRSTATEVRRAGTHVDGTTLARRLGEPLRRLLLGELGHSDPEVRERLAGAMDRLAGVDVAEAMLERLHREEDLSVRTALLRFRGYRAVGDRAFPVLTGLLAADPEPVIRTCAAFLLESFGPAAAPALLAALRDVVPTRRAAVMSLGRVGDLGALPALMEVLADPEAASFRRETTSAMRDIVAEAAAATEPESTPAPDLAERIRGLIAEEPDRWPTRHATRVLGALPLHSTLIYLWAIRPDGEILCIDHEAFALPHEPETDPLARFAVMVQGARRHPELAVLIPRPPRHAEACEPCLGLGYPADGNYCTGCNGLGWRVWGSKG